MPHATVRVVDVYPYRFREDALEFLVLRRASGHAYEDTWRMVGGKIEPGETAWQAALREFREETSLTAHRFWTIPSVNVFYEWSRDTVALVPAFAVQASGEVILDGEHTESVWLPPEAAGERLAWPEQQRLLLLAARYAASGGIVPEWEIPLGQ